MASSAADQPPARHRPEAADPGIRLCGAIARSEVDSLADRISVIVRACGPGVIHCDVGEVDGPGLPTIDALAHAALAARSAGCELRLEHASPALLELVELCGLDDVLRCADAQRGPDRSAPAADGSG